MSTPPDLAAVVPAPERHRVLCVDDEPNLLAGLGRHLGRTYDLTCASNGHEALGCIHPERPFAVVIADRQMPGMDGTVLLARMREVAPHTVRIMLTGNADLTAAISVVNEGQIFRFLTKPCPPMALLQAVKDAVEQHRLLEAERVLQEETLRGCISTLTEVLSLANPVAFGRASRLRTAVREVALGLGLDQAWEIEVAAMLSQIGFITLPPEVMDKFARGDDLTETEQGMVERIPGLNAKLLAPIPRLERIRQMLLLQDPRVRARATEAGHDASAGAGLLHAVQEWDLLVTRGLTSTQAAEALRNPALQHDPDVVRELGRWTGAAENEEEVGTYTLRTLPAHGVLAEDIRTTDGVLIIGRGHELTSSLVLRLRNFALTRGVHEPIHVITLRTGKKEQTKDAA